MIPNFYITGSGQQRPESRKTIYADGSADATFREGVDMELSHWIPNRTPAEYRADTTTEICMKWAADQTPERIAEEWDLAINNHLDVDGVLSIFTLVHSEYALQHRDVIVQAAAMGDFWAWGDREAQVLFQGLTLYFMGLKTDKVDVREIYERCFDKVFALIEKGDADMLQAVEGVTALERSTELVETGVIERKGFYKRFAHYHIPAELAAKRLDKALHVPKFNDPMGEYMWLLPSVRDHFDTEKVHLVSVEGENGWYYDLWYPGYMWADTADKWRAPGFEFAGSTNGYYYGYEPLNRVVEQLQALEMADGTWTLAKELSPFASVKGRGFPIVLAFLDRDNKPAQSSLPPAQVAFMLGGIFETATVAGN